MSLSLKNLFLHKFLFLLPFLICILFFISYSTLSIVRYDNYQAFGYDLGINDQAVWRYSQFQSPLTTIDPLPDKTKLVEHIELVYALVAPFYWIWSTRRMLLLVQAAAICISGIAVYLLARRKGLNKPVSLTALIGYLGFFGVQNAIWFDAHSSVFGAAFLAWFIYFLETKKKTLSIIFFFLAITSKENFALYTLSIALVLFLKNRTKLLAFFMMVSTAYLIFIFFIYFPYIVHTTYLYQNSGGLLSNLNPISLVDTEEKRKVILFSFLSFGFLPLLSPLYLIPVLGHFVTYFVVANNLSGAQGFFGQYRISLAPMLVWATIISISEYKFNKWKIVIYLMICFMTVQYVLHLPLNYLPKDWFWRQPDSVVNINNIISNYLPATASVVAQNNIVPHISQRDKIYSLYPYKRDFDKNSPCGKKSCDWFRWYDSPQFLFVDTSKDWDVRHLLANRGDFINGLKNLEKAKIIIKYKKFGDATLYKVIENHAQYN